MPNSKRRSSAGKDALSGMSEEEVIASLPEYITRMFNEVGFAKWNKDYLPILCLNPFYVSKPPDVRVQWQTYYDRFKKSKTMKMAHLVFWYGSSPHEPEFSMMGPNTILTYEQAKAKGLHVLPTRIQNKIDKGKSLTVQEDMIYFGLKDLDADRGAPKELRWTRDELTNDDGEASESSPTKEVAGSTEYELILKSKIDSVLESDSPPRKKRKKSEKVAKRRSVSRGRSKKQLPSSKENDDDGEEVLPSGSEKVARDSEGVKGDIETQDVEEGLASQTEEKEVANGMKDESGEEETSTKPENGEEDKTSVVATKIEKAEVSDEIVSPDGVAKAADTKNVKMEEDGEKEAEQSEKELDDNNNLADEENDKEDVEEKEMSIVKEEETSKLDKKENKKAGDDQDFVPEEKNRKRKSGKVKSTAREEEAEPTSPQKKKRGAKRKKNDNETMQDVDDGHDKKGQRVKNVAHDEKLTKGKEKDRLKRAHQKAQHEFEQNEEVLLPLMQKLKGLAFAPYEDINKEKILKTLSKMESHAGEIVPSFIKIHKIGMLLKDVRKHLQGEEKQRGGDKSTTGEIAERIKSLGAILKKNYHEKLLDVPTDFEAKATKPFVSGSGPAGSGKAPQAPPEPALKKSKSKSDLEVGKTKRVSVELVTQSKEDKRAPVLKKSFSIGSMIESSDNSTQPNPKGNNNNSAVGNEKKRPGVPSWLYASPKNETPKEGYRSFALEWITTALDALPPLVWTRLRKTNPMDDEFVYDDIAVHIEQAIFSWTEHPREPKGPSNKLGRSKLASNPNLKNRENLYWCKLHEVVGGLVGQSMSPAEMKERGDNNNKSAKPTDLAKKVFLQFAYKEAHDLVMLPTLTFYNSMEGREENAVHPALKIS